MGHKSLRAAFIQRLTLPPLPAIHSQNSCPISFPQARSTPATLASFLSLCAPSMLLPWAFALTVSSKTLFLNISVTYSHASLNFCSDVPFLWKPIPKTLFKITTTPCQQSRVLYPTQFLSSMGHGNFQHSI